MKRRDFLIGAGLTGAIGPSLARAAIPCPPPTLSAGAGHSVSTSCPSAGAQQDWQARISAPGVVWYNGFASAAEVNAFRWASGIGNDPGATAPNANYVSWVAPGADGPAAGTFGYLSQFRPAGGTDNDEVWWRPFSPMTSATNGKGVNDPANGGTIALQSWNSNNVNELAQWNNGWYTQNSAIAQDGTDFYLQIRIKMDPNASATGAISPAKLLEIGIAERTFTSQNIVTYLNGSYNDPAYNFHQMYLDYNVTALQQDNITPSNADPYILQVGGTNYAQGHFCDSSNASTYNNCWYYDLTGGWDTLLYHITPGPAGNNSTCGLQVYAAHQGQTTYTKIWDVQLLLPQWQGPGQEGWQALYLAVYSNGAQNYVQPKNITSKYAQIVFSKQFINCPQY